MNFSSWFRGLKGKLLFTAVLPVAGFAILSAISFEVTSKLTFLLESAHSEIIPNVEALGEMRQARNRFGYKAFAAFSEAEHGADIKDEFESAKKSLEEFKTAYADYASSAFMPEEAKRHEEIKNVISALIGQMEKVLGLLDKHDTQSLAEARQILNGEYEKAGDAVGLFNREVVAMYKKRATEEGKEAKSAQAQSRQWILLVTLFAAFSVFGILLWIAARVSNSIASIAQRLTGSSQQVAASVEQLNEAGNSLSQSSTEAAASLEETVASLEELSSMVQLNSDNAQQAATLSVSSRDAAEKGQQEIVTLIEAMSNISQSSKKIEEIISVIDDIAFQTNLLALNASVEAARAGEQGKGFAVVAEAVRALAQRSADAAKDITALIKESVSQVEDGSRIAGKSGEVLNNIVISVKKVSDLNNEIASASSEQTSGIQQISKAMNQLDQASQSNAASAEEISASSGEISSLATTTQALTVELNYVITGETQTTNSLQTKASRESTKPSNVVPLRRRKQASAQATIPFDEDRSRVGTTDGF